MTAKKTDSKAPAAAAGETQAQNPLEDVHPTPTDGQLDDGVFRENPELPVDQGLDENGVPLGMQELVNRDPFTAEYVQFRLDQARGRRENAQSVDTQKRADLLTNPHLMEKPAEVGNRGAVAVWRSLRDLLREESTTLMDTSNVHELQMLRRELFSRKTLIEAVTMGLDMQLKRLDERIKIATAEAKAAKQGSAGSPDTPKKG